MTASSGSDALEMMHRLIFDALVINGAQDTLDILNFTAKAQGLQPSIAVFVADDWGEELRTGLKEFEQMQKMLQDDECVMLAVESRATQHVGGSPR